ncbi:MAG: hypothetical protein MUE43_12040 [Serpentinimonas sp.]|jgi:hypothetical protein|nr:hypothetical protein [Serpentinimonas sp.]
MGSSSHENTPIPQEWLALLVGILITSLPLVVAGLGWHDSSLTSISATYHLGGLSRDWFVGTLMAVACIMLCYGGNRGRRRMASLIGAVAAFGVALLPCGCGRQGIDRYVSIGHFLCAAVLFVCLLVVCWDFRKHAQEKLASQKVDPVTTHRRVAVYTACAFIMLLGMGLAGVGNWTSAVQALALKGDRWVYWGEAVALVGFGVSWFTAAKVLPFLAAPQDRPQFLP